MKIFDRITDIQEYVRQEKLAGKTVGFVPTMGALHEGHLSLVRRSIQDNQLTIVSIFVNPIQFNNPDDLKNYPRTLETDTELLQNEGTDILFIPTVDEIYPEEVTEKYDFGELGLVMEGAFRPGHFNGVAIVVRRLLEIVKPDKAYFGEKDYQQLAIIKVLTEKANMPVKIIQCPISRELDGLARSSRNVRLEQRMREAAPFIYSELLRAQDLAKEFTAEEVESKIQEAFKNHELLKLEYFTIADGETLMPVTGQIKTNDHAFIAVFAGEVRLIDNIRLI